VILSLMRDLFLVMVFVARRKFDEVISLRGELLYLWRCAFVTDQARGSKSSSNFEAGKSLLKSCSPTFILCYFFVNGVVESVVVVSCGSIF